MTNAFYRSGPTGSDEINKDITESRSHGFSNSSSRGKSGVLLGKPSYKKENGTNNYTSASSLASEMAGNNMNCCGYLTNLYSSLCWKLGVNLNLLALAFLWAVGCKARKRLQDR
ncbi:hypothetical protein CsSME_00007731 [Camellia sinensis var. sinensis]